MISRSLLKVYVPRFCKALKIASREAGLALNPNFVLITEQTDGNEVLYRLRAKVEWRHIPIRDSHYTKPH